MFVHLSSSKLIATIANTRPLPQLLLCIRHHSSTKLFIAGFLFLQPISSLSDYIPIPKKFQLFKFNIWFCFVLNEGLSYNTNETVLGDTFKQHGQVIEGKIIEQCLRSPNGLFWN